MQLTAELELKAIARVKHYVDLANQKNVGLNLSYPVVSFKLRGRTAGTANSALNVIKLNAGLFVRNVDNFLNDTIPHEVAHLVQYKLHPSSRYWTGRKWVRSIQPHGPEWQRVMYSFGLKPTRCHKMDTSEVTVKKNVTKYQYKCNCKVYEVGAKIHNKIQMGHKYTCKHCRSALSSSSFVVAKRPAPVIAKPIEASKLPRPGSKKEVAEHWFFHYRNHPNAREMVIAVLMNEEGMSKAGASTYYYNAMKKFG